MPDSPIAAPPQLSFLKKLDLIPGVLSLLGTAIYASISGPWRGSAGHSKYGLHVGNTTFRRLQTRLSVAQSQFILPKTNKAYEQWCKSKKREPVTDTLPNGTQAHWIGKRDAMNVMLYYHGGGFVLPASPAYFDFLDSLVDQVTTAGKSFSVVILTYTLAPEAIYPTQLEQCVELLRYILNTTSRKPSDIIIAGDSAGGNLTLGVLSHLTHQHPKINPLSLSEPLLGAILISPWVSFDSSRPLIKVNTYKDCIDPIINETWAQALLGGQEPDYYAEACRAPADWWKELKVKDILVIGGADEVLIHSIREIAKKLEDAHPNTTTVIVEKETHDQHLLALAVGDRSETETGKAICAWAIAKL